EVDDLDLDAVTEESVTVVEWGEGMVEHLADAHLLVRLARGEGEARRAELVGRGGDWPHRLAAVAARQGGEAVLVLGLDTATPAVGAAVVTVDEQVTTRAWRRTVDPRAHAELLGPQIRAVLAEAGAGPADLAAIVAGTGPGPFTGLRVGLATAAAMGQALG